MSTEEKRGASARAVRHHYDQNNEFFRLWLDGSMTYSCALFEPGDDLESAQRRKLDHHVREARVRGAVNVLDIGCGWGSGLRRIVDEASVRRAVGLTLSEAQAGYVAGFADPRIEVRLESWEDHEPREPYDAIISIGAFEHFAGPGMTDREMTARYARFFERCHGWLKPNGWLSLQTIAYGTAKREQINSFILEHIFPESDLPSLETIVPALRGTFELAGLRNDREHYADTFRAWSARLDAGRAQAERLVGVEVVERYRRYHGLFTIGFHTGAMQLLRLTLRRLGASSVKSRD